MVEKKRRTKFKLSNLIKTATLLWLIMILTSCASLRGCVSCLPALNPDTPEWRHESFVKIEMEITLAPSSCGVLPPGIECERLVSTLPPVTMRASGSGIVVRSLSHSTFILTADHVCRGQQVETINIPTASGPAQVVMSRSLRLKTVDYYGNVRYAEYFSSDAPNDICLIRTKGTWGAAVPIAESLPEIGERVYNVAAPTGIFNPGMVPMFEGFFSGSDTRRLHYYTVPARPGSSGSSILNRHGEIVAVIHSAYTGFENIAICSSLTSIHELIESINQ